MIRALHRLIRRFRKPIAIPGKYPWSIKVDDPVPYGTILWRGKWFNHVADGCGGVISISNGRPKPPFPGRASPTKRG